MPAVAIKARALFKKYGQVTAVDGLSLEVFDGEVFGLLGPNGAGKTTSINMLCGLLIPDSGEVLLHGKPIRKGDAGTRRRVGVCPQNITLWTSLTCLEQMQFLGELYGLDRKAAKQRSLRLLQDMGLEEKKDSLARHLSGGMQRRLNLAMALVHDPDILVLDEPEAGLDPQSRVMLREYVKSLAHRKTIILTTHNMDEAERLADRVAILDHGCLLTVDTPDSLKHSIGEGDVLEIELDGEPEKALLALQTMLPQVTCRNQTLLIRAHGVVDLLPAILNGLRAIQVQPQEVRLRPNSLEDVFIALTGRRLRE
jgi:ABC-2 type transport system ATP-binding protein